MLNSANLYLPSGKYSVRLPIMENFSDILRRTITDCGRSRYEISKETGIAESILSRFIHGERGLSLQSVDKLVAFLGIELNHRKRKDA
jgi:ribosome-binding protein aMBF1 (putative translation factor)